MTIQTITFSQMTVGGDIANNDHVPGLLSGANVLFNIPWTFLPPGSTGDRPIPNPDMYYLLRLNTDTNLYEYYDASILAWVTLNTEVNFVWNTVTTNTTMVGNNGYFVDSSANITLTLPATCNIGEQISIAGINTGLWIIAQNANQSILISPLSTTVGVGGSLTANDGYDSINLVCCVANQKWICLGGPQSKGLAIV